MARMTDQEADYWDEYYMKNPPAPGSNGTGFFTQKRRAEGSQAAYSLTVDSLTADWLLTKAIDANKTPSEIVSDIVRKEIAAAM
jgi:hypothetical protein